MAIGTPAAPVSGIILINKPRGMTSFGVISRMRKLTGIKRIGHTGTLDPFADGLLPVCIGRATAAVQFMDGYDKTYRLGIEFGRSTDTQDLTGKTLFEHELTAQDRQTLLETDFAGLRDAVASLKGERQQLPPMFSAVKIDGRPLYEYARRGEDIERKKRLIKVYDAQVLSVSLDEVLRAEILISCSKGTYIRTLADDLGQMLGFGAHAATLTRLKCGPFDLNQAQDIEQLFAWRETCASQNEFCAFLAEKGILLPIDHAFSSFPAIELPDPEAIRLSSGLPLLLNADELNQMLPGQPPDSLAVVRSRNRLIGVVRLLPETSDTIRLKSERMLINLADFRQA